MGGDRRIGCRCATDSRDRAGRLAQHHLHRASRRRGAGSTATFITADNQTNMAQLSTMPGSAFQANAVLPDPHHAGMQVAVKWQYSANVHCEIDVDDKVFV